MTKLSRLAHPFRSNCTSEFPADIADYAAMHNEYSEANCLMACLLEHVN